MRAVYRSRLLFGTAVLIFATGASYACGDFLEGAPQGALDETTLANAAGVEATLIAAYRTLDWANAVGGGAQSAAASNWSWGSVTSDDAYKGTEASDAPEITDLELYNWRTGAVESLLNDKWRNTYEGVVRSNATIKLLNQVVEANPNEISQENQDRIRGEALFLRAYYHFEAYRMWGNIPYYTEADTTFRKSNQGVDALALIEADLDQAISLLPASQSQVGRATAWTARAYKGKVQVYDENWSGAISTLSQVVNQGPYALEQDFSRVWTGYESYSNGPETVFAYQASSNDGEPNGNNANYGERLNFPHSGSPFGCCGFHQPTQNLVNFFSVDDSGLPLALTDPNWNARDDKLDAAASADMLLDPRLDWTVGRDGVPYKDWGNHEAGWIRAPAFGGPYSPKKTAYESASGAMSNVGWVNTQLSSMNMHLLRFADVMLLLAEAEVEGGNFQNARPLVNEIRRRAGVAAQGPNGGPLAVPIDDLSITWADYRIGEYSGADWTDQTFARTAVRYERRLELAMEGERFFDLRRWGIAASVLNSYIAVEQNRRAFLAAATTYADRHNLYPIPPIQIELSKVEGQETLVQNTGW